VRVYVAGPYTKGDVAVNVANAIDAGTTIAEAGHFPFIPHLTHFWHYRSEHPYEFWIAQDLEWLKVCDAVVRLPGESSGADGEVAVAQKRGTPVFHSLADFFDYARLHLK
jgi:hypothetical protein